jgi:hypothetical protein
MPGNACRGRTSKSDDEALYRGSQNGDRVMKPECTLTDRILEAVSEAPGCRIADVVCQFPDLTWNQVFRELARLSRNGQLRVILNRRGLTIRSVDRSCHTLTKITP